MAFYKKKYIKNKVGTLPEFLMGHWYYRLEQEELKNEENGWDLTIIFFAWNLIDLICKG